MSFFLNIHKCMVGEDSVHLVTVLCVIWNCVVPFSTLVAESFSFHFHFAGCQPTGVVVVFSYYISLKCRDMSIY